MSGAYLLVPVDFLNAVGAFLVILAFSIFIAFVLMIIFIERNIEYFTVSLFRFIENQEKSASSRKKVSAKGLKSKSQRSRRSSSSNL